MSSSFRRKRLKIIGLIALGILVLYLGLTSLLSPKAVSIPSGSPEVVIVTVMEPDLGSDYVAQIKENRDEYAARHGEEPPISNLERPKLIVSIGYMTFYPNTSDYNVGSAPRTWSLIPALRHAMTLYPHTTYFFSLSPHALFMNPALSLTSHIMAPQRLESLMLKDKPVVPPDSVIHTFSHIKGDKIDLILTQDGEGLCQESFILRQGEWAQFFLDIWFDPLYRSYNFQKAEGHALVSSSIMQILGPLPGISTDYACCRSTLSNGTLRY